MSNTIPDVSIVIVNYKTPQLLFDCIESVYAVTKSISIEIIVVDNDSQDESEQKIKTGFPLVKWINSGYNAGFSRANNTGIRSALGKYILLLNSDTLLRENAIEKSFKRYRELETKTQIGFLGCRLYHLASGAVQLNSNTQEEIWRKLFRSNAMYKFFRKLFSGNKPVQEYKATYERMQKEHEKEHETLWLGGTFLLFNSSLCKEHNYYLDEDFFMYAEDHEWCVRIKNAGYHHFYFPGTGVLHVEGGSFTLSERKFMQITVSHWLLVMKIYGKILFCIFVLVTLFNLSADELLFRVGKLSGRTSEEEEKKSQRRKKEFRLMQQCIFPILFHYKQKASTSKYNLKYEG